MDAICPIFAVSLAAGATEILLIVGNQFIELGAGFGDVFRTRDRRVVTVENLVYHGQRCVSVEGYVMRTHVPKNAIIGDAKKCTDDEGVRQQVHIAAIIGIHPVTGASDRIGFAAKVDNLQMVVDRLVNNLHRHTVDLDDPCEGHLGLTTCVDDQLAKKFLIERPIIIPDVDVLRDGYRVIRRETFRKPHAALRGRQLEQRTTEARFTTIVRRVLLAHILTPGLYRLAPIPAGYAGWLRPACPGNRSRHLPDLVSPKVYFYGRKR
ncbi:Uncharacterised protein [Mycobacteroides abscessus subsp. abscessus]|nr:Uncharacterised protein [Mycobacteroides abscessus subsp. abscessus]